MLESSDKSSQPTSVSVILINDKGVLLNVEGNDYFLSYDRVPWFRNAKVSEVLDVTKEGRNAICWRQLDVDLEIDSLKYPDKYPLIMNG